MTNTTPPHHLRALSGEPEWSVLDRYFSSECTPEEVDAVDRWVAADDSHAELIGFLRRIWEEGGVVRPAIDEEADWHALHARIAAAQSDRAPVRAPLRALHHAPLSMAPRPSGRSRIARAMVVAGGLAAAVTVAAVWGAKRTAQAPEEVAQYWHEYATDRGQRATVMLVDGTRVWLSVDSKLRIAPGYASSTRDVELEGEAFFEVRHDDRLPFRVHTPGAVAEDLGTEFSVRAYPGDSATVVIVADGVVALRRASPAHATAASPGVKLTRGQMGLLHPSGTPTVVDGVDMTTLLSWRHGALEFQEMPLASAIRELERWYDVEITLGDPSLARVPLTATFDDQSVDQALSVVAGALDVRYERDGRQVRLTMKSARR